MTTDTQTREPEVDLHVSGSFVDIEVDTQAWLEWATEPLDGATVHYGEFAEEFADSKPYGRAHHPETVEAYVDSVDELETIGSYNSYNFDSLLGTILQWWEVRVTADVTLGSQALTEGDVLVFAQHHYGGDARGNYGAPEVRLVNPTGHGIPGLLPPTYVDLYCTCGAHWTSQDSGYTFFPFDGVYGDNVRIDPIDVDDPDTVEDVEALREAREDYLWVTEGDGLTLFSTDEVEVLDWPVVAERVRERDGIDPAFYVDHDEGTLLCPDCATGELFAESMDLTFY